MPDNGACFCAEHFPSRTVRALCDAVVYVLNRIQQDPDLRWVMGWGTESFHRLCVAEAAVKGEEVNAVEGRRRVDLQPDYRKREPEVVVLREKLRAAGVE